MNTVWVLVCDAANASLFEVREHDPSFCLIERVDHESSRKKVNELASDRQGTRYAEGRSVHHDALAPSSSPKDVEKERFAHALAETLDVALRSARFDKWVLVAPPHFVGLVKKDLTSELAKHLMNTVEKDLTALALPELAQRLHDAVQIPPNERDVFREEKKRPH